MSKNFVANVISTEIFGITKTPSRQEKFYDLAFYFSAFVASRLKEFLEIFLSFWAFSFLKRG
jgi:hypothetical protein